MRRRPIGRRLVQRLAGDRFIRSRVQSLGVDAGDALMDVRRGRAVDQQTEQFGTAVVAARVHEPLAQGDLGEIKICDHFAFTGLERPADDLAVRIRNGSEEAAGDRPDGSACVLHDLGLLIGIEPRRRADHEACRIRARADGR